MQVSCEFDIELLLDLEATYSPAYYPQTPRGEYQPIDPPEPASVEDVSIVGIRGSRWMMVDGKMKLHQLNMLAGVNVNEPNFLRFLDNLRDLIGDNADDALMDDVSEDCREYERKDF